MAKCWLPRFLFGHGRGLKGMNTTTTYKIVRFHRDNPEKNGETIEEGLTLKEAQKHCSRKDTAGDGWFDGYREEE